MLRSAILRRQGGSEKEYVLIFDATTLIVLLELKCEELIERIRNRRIARVIIPQGVRSEFLEAGVIIDIAGNDIPNNYTSEPVPDIPRSLGEGERQAIGIAHTIARSRRGVVIVITDDKKARSLCKRMGLKVFGTLGFIEFAKKHGAVTKEEALSLLEKIPNTSLYIKPELLKEAQAKIEQQ